MRLYAAHGETVDGASVTDWGIVDCSDDASEAEILAVATRQLTEKHGPLQKLVIQLASRELWQGGMSVATMGRVLLSLDEAYPYSDLPHDPWSRFGLQLIQLGMQLERKV